MKQKEEDELKQKEKAKEEELLKQQNNNAFNFNRDYEQMDSTLLENEMITLKEEIKKIQALIEKRKPKSDDIMNMEKLICEQFDNNIDSIPEVSQATQWKISHVGAWMRNVLHFPQYIGTIYRKKIDGDIVLRDFINKEAICDILEIHDNELHVKHVFREVSKLKDACGLNDENNNKADENENTESMKKKLEEMSAQLESTNNDLTSIELKYEEISKEKTKYEENQTLLHNQIKKMTDENIGTTNQCEALKIELSKLIDKEKECTEYKMLLEHERKNKINSIRELSLELDTFRKASRVMTRQIEVYRDFIENSGFHPMDHVFQYLGYEKQNDEDHRNEKKNNKNNKKSKNKHY